MELYQRSSNVKLGSTSPVHVGLLMRTRARHFLALSRREHLKNGSLLRQHDDPEIGGERPCVVLEVVRHLRVCAASGVSDMRAWLYSTAWVCASAYDQVHVCVCVHASVRIWTYLLQVAQLNKCFDIADPDIVQLKPTARFSQSRG